MNIQAIPYKRFGRGLVGARRGKGASEKTPYASGVVRPAVLGQVEAPLQADLVKALAGLQRLALAGGRASDGAGQCALRAPPPSVL